MAMQKREAAEVALQGRPVDAYEEVIQRRVRSKRAMAAAALLAVVGGGAYLAASKAPVPIAGPQTTTTTPALGAGHTIITGSSITGTFADHRFAPAVNPPGLTFLPAYTATALTLFTVPENYGTALGKLTANTPEFKAPPRC